MRSLLALTAIADLVDTVPPVEVPEPVHYRALSVRTSPMGVECRHAEVGDDYAFDCVAVLRGRRCGVRFFASPNPTEAEWAACLDAADAARARALQQMDEAPAAGVEVGVDVSRTVDASSRERIARAQAKRARRALARGLPERGTP